MGRGCASIFSSIFNYEPSTGINVLWHDISPTPWLKRCLSAAFPNLSLAGLSYPYYPGFDPRIFGIESQRASNELPSASASLMVFIKKK